MTSAWAAGGILATAKDNAMYWSKLMLGEVLSVDAWAEMSATVPLGGGTSYGLGIFRYTNFNGQTVWSHGGTNVGSINENIGDPVSGVGISVLTNQDSISNSILLNSVVKELHKVTMDPMIGIAEAEVVPFSVYPNPTAQVFYIDRAKGGLVDLVVYDRIGRVVMEAPSIATGAPVDISMLPSGSYVVELWDGPVRSLGRLVVRR